jgi:RimJ/RimL family protein N-acetyltransferase
VLRAAAGDPACGMRSVSNGGFNELGLHKISATCDPANRASVAVLTKNGMHQEGVLRHHFMSGASGEIDSCSASFLIGFV